MKKENENTSNVENKEEIVNDEKNSKSEQKEELTIEEKLKETEDKLTRSYAELENQRRRYEKEKDEAYEFGGMSLAKECLNLTDNLERSKLSILDNIFTKVVLPAPDGEDKIIITPFLFKGIYLLICFTFDKFNSITNC